MFAEVPEAFQHRADEWLFVPLYHIFGSEELSMLTPEVADLAPQPYIGLNPADMEGLRHGSEVELTVGDVKRRLPVKLMPELPNGVAGLPAGLPGEPRIELPARGRVALVSS